MVGEQRYYPFGETRLTTGSTFTDRLLTGQREMTVLGIYHFNAHYYSPKLGRFCAALRSPVEWAFSSDTIAPGYSMN